MLKNSLILTAVTLLISQAVFANHEMMMGDPDKAKSEQCEMIANACKKAGFNRENGKGKLFWFDCMKPVLYNQSVKGVELDKKVVRSCRDFKIRNLEDQVNALKKVNND